MGLVGVVAMDFNNVIYFLLGFIASFLGSLSGLGGGFIAIPSLYYLGVGMPYAAATSKFMVLVTSVVSSIRYRGKIGFKTSMFLAVSIPMVIAAYVGAYLLAVLPVSYLTFIVSVVLLLSAVRMLMPQSPGSSGEGENSKSKNMSDGIKFLVSGGIAGLVGGVTGLGGGVINVPVFIYLLKLDVKVAVSLSMACIVPSALSAVIRHVIDDVIVWSIGVPLSMGAAVGAWLGPIVAVRAKRETLKKIIGVLIATATLRILVESALSIAGS